MRPSPTPTRSCIRETSCRDAQNASYPSAACVCGTEKPFLHCYALYSTELRHEVATAFADIKKAIGKAIDDEDGSPESSGRRLRADGARRRLKTSLGEGMTKLIGFLKKNGPTETSVCCDKPIPIPWPYTKGILDFELRVKIKFDPVTNAIGSGLLSELGDTCPVTDPLSDVPTLALEQALNGPMEFEIKLCMTGGPTAYPVTFLH